ncbi:MAG: PAS domain-containing sensor histidine kinase [Cryobacterium sp.]|nr:PAS domain-containing sensor histidine kinase [Oligoflexia bacterium]
MEEAHLNAREYESSQYGSVLDNALDCVVVMNERGEIVHWNKQSEGTFGWAHDEVIGKVMSQVIVPAQHRQAHDRGLQHFLRSGEGPVLNHRIEITALRRDGMEFPVELTITPVRTEKGEFHFYSFLRDISAREDADRKHHDLLMSLESALSARDEFIGIASHELKTPLTSLRLQFQMAERQMAAGDLRAYSQESVQKRIGVTNRQIDRMLHLIDGMLDISRIASGKLHVALSNVDLSSVVNELAERFSDQWLLARSSVTLDIEPEVYVRCDVYRMEQVVSNLITNTIKYGAGRPVHLCLKKDAETAEFSIQDQGMGISKEDHDRIFNRFERAVPCSSVSGLGLGLYITRQILESQGGSIRVESEVGKGSNFIFRMPLVLPGLET